MIRIDSYLHRDVLSELIRRWMYHDVRPDDADRIACLVNFNHLYVSRCLRLFSEGIFQELYPGGISRRPALRKGDLKDALVVRPPYRNARIDELIGEYRAHPERYYRDTPFHGMLFFAHREGIDECIGSSRIKRARRLAEKAARRIIDRMFDNIKKHADILADDRARRLGISRDQLVTPPEEMQDEFLKAESRVLDELRRGKPLEDEEDILISDVAGIKMILEAPQQEQLTALLNRLPDCRIAEEESHDGPYNATNLIVCYRPDRDRILSRPVGGRILSLMQARGMEPEQIRQAFAEFVMTGEKAVSLEIIVSNYEETLESEIGRCIHEDRIIKQRLTRQYRGHLSKNIEYLMEYLFAFPMSAHCDLTELPIKLWNRYLPDYFDEVLKDLFHIPSDGLLDDDPC
ncbi:MAG: hypothetical protein C0394_04625 [Syntrophus sp. (in: bacteria)]|nr:hypothetical protein [Syntrophus sp. (in: bacteria)]